jgi:hypothetical protein
MTIYVSNELRLNLNQMHVPITRCDVERLPGPVVEGYPSNDLSLDTCRCGNLRINFIAVCARAYVTSLHDPYTNIGHLRFLRRRQNAHGHRGQTPQNDRDCNCDKKHRSHVTPAGDTIGTLTVEFLRHFYLFPFQK